MLFTNKQTEALEKAIKKWEGVCFHGEFEEGTADCACCYIWLRSYCIGCPISQYTGCNNCTKTPYFKWIDHQRVKHKHLYYETKKIRCKECSFLALKELWFLRDLWARTILLRRLQ